MPIGRFPHAALESGHLKKVTVEQTDILGFTAKLRNRFGDNRRFQTHRYCNRLFRYGLKVDGVPCVCDYQTAVFIRPSSGYVSLCFRPATLHALMAERHP